jgi:hypothetical protein
VLLWVKGSTSHRIASQACIGIPPTMSSSSSSTTWSRFGTRFDRPLVVMLLNRARHCGHVLACRFAHSAMQKPWYLWLHPGPERWPMSSTAMSCRAAELVKTQSLCRLNAAESTAAAMASRQRTSMQIWQEIIGCMCDDSGGAESRGLAPASSSSCCA